MKISVSPGVVYTIASSNKPMHNAEITSTTYETDAYSIIHYALGEGVRTSPERLNHPALYVAAQGTVRMHYKEDDNFTTKDLQSGESLIRPASLLASFEGMQDCVYTEIRFPQNTSLAPGLKEKEIFEIKNLVSYSESEAVSQLRLIEDPLFRMHVFAISAGHETPCDVLTEGDAIASCLEGTVIVIYDEKPYLLHEDETIMCAAGHKVQLKAEENAKMLTIITKDEPYYRG